MDLLFRYGLGALRLKSYFILLYKKLKKRRLYETV
jgi:hypothetical protein